MQQRVTESTWSAQLRGHVITREGCARIINNQSTFSVASCLDCVWVLLARRFFIERSAVIKFHVIPALITAARSRRRRVINKVSVYKSRDPFKGTSLLRDNNNRALVSTVLNRFFCCTPKPFLPAWLTASKLPAKFRGNSRTCNAIRDDVSPRWFAMTRTRAAPTLTSDNDINCVTRRAFCLSRIRVTRRSSRNSRLNKRWRNSQDEAANGRPEARPG